MAPPISLVNLFHIVILPIFRASTTKLMINFFRKIRKKMTDEKRPLRYMSYAFGEIVLVVVGILITLR